MVVFLPWHLATAYALDLVIGDPQRFPHPVRWMGRLVCWMEKIFYDGAASPLLQRLGGFVLWVFVLLTVLSGAVVLIELSSHIHRTLGTVVVIYMAYTTLATRSLHAETRRVVRALRKNDLPLARERLAMVVSRDTSSLGERDIVRALLETVSENLSDGVVAPLFYLALGGPLAALAYKAVNTMDSMLGYLTDRYRYFGWFPARADDVLNFIPARLTALVVIAAAACLRLDWRNAWRITRRDARKMKSPNAGYPEAAAAGALGVQLGGTNIYFGQPVEKPLLGDGTRDITLDDYRTAIRLMYVCSLLGLGMAVPLRLVVLL